ncbi:hypothetical protein QD47_04365 [Paenibacillus terrae]|uniref:Uncharacterized protein n=1 Tax=Paenibacillus terrae TaxID=159743 RepID=A0A0D7X5U8_9BACL|nr:hypothetical protein QD47_04365 [Paenibacillus terrae]
MFPFYDYTIKFLEMKIIAWFAREKNFLKKVVDLNGTTIKLFHEKRKIMNQYDFYLDAKMLKGSFSYLISTSMTCL